MIAKTLTGALAALSLGAAVTATSVTPASADAGSFFAGAITGGVLGSIAGAAAGPRPYYAAPVEYGPPPACWIERRPVLDPYGYVVGHERTRVCR